MDSSHFPVSRSPRKELQGPRPPALRVNKDSHKIRKPPVAPQPSQSHHQQQHHQPVIIYTVSPKVIHTNPSDFMALVQRLTGSSSTSSSLNDDRTGAISPAARYATIEKAKTPREGMMKKQEMIGDEGFAERIEMAGGSQVIMERASNLCHGILSPGPASLPPIPQNFFSPVAADPNLVSFFHDLSPVLHSNRNFIEGSFMPSPSNFVSPLITSPTPIDLFNNFNNFNNSFDF